jgi:SAM-dependent methyltransferase
MASQPNASNVRDDWDQHWDVFAQAALDNPAQDYRRGLAMGLLEQGQTPVRLLDLGSGQGDFLAHASRRWRAAELLGVEPSGNGVAIARTRVPGARFEVLDLTSDPPPQELHGWATHALCSEVLEHVDDDLGLLRAARALMAPNCRFVITVPGGRMSAFDVYIGHRRHYTAASLSALVSDAGFEVERTSAAGFPFLNLYRRVVIARGEHVVDDAKALGERRFTALLTRAALLPFGPLLHFSLGDSGRGTQILAVCCPTSA